MGDLGVDTEVTALGDGDGETSRYRAGVSRDWEIWGPNGGYMAAIALRAAGAASAFDRPASFACHYLSVADFDKVDITVTSVRRSRKAESQRVVMHQGDKPVLEAMTWFVDDIDGLDHDDVAMPDVPAPADTPTILEHFEADGVEHTEPPHPFWRNFEARPVDWIPRADTSARKPELREWFRFAPTPTFADPVTDTARVLLLLDTMMWPAAWRAYPGENLPYFAPSIDVMASFHDVPAGSEWLLVHARSPLAGHGLVAGSAEVYSEDGRLLGSAVSQMLCRRNPGYATE